MSARETLLVPCEVFTVEAQMVPEGGLGALERLLLQVAWELPRDPSRKGRKATFDELKHISGLGSRMVLDAIHELWQHGHLTLDDQSGEVEVSPELAEAIRKDPKWYEKLESTEVRSETFQLIQEQICGTIQPVQPVPFGIGEGRKLPAIVPRGAWQDASAHDGVLRAVDEVLSRRTLEGRIWRTRSFTLRSVDQTTPEQVTRDMAIEVSVWREPGADLLGITVDQPRSLGTRFRQILARRIAELAAEAPDEPVIQRLENEAARHEERGEGDGELDLEMERLERDVRESSSLDPERAGAMHERLESRAQLAGELLDELGETDLQVEVLTGAEAIDEQVREALRTARYQVILACPFVQHAPLKRFEGDLRTALARNVDVFVLWGMSADKDESLETGPRNVLDNLREELRREGHPERLHYSRQSSRLHAKLVVRDADLAVIGSSNFLSRAEVPKLEMGVRVSGPKRAPFRFAARLCRWARDHYPDFSSAAAIVTTVEEFRRYDEAFEDVAPTADGLSIPWPEPPGPPSVEGRLPSRARVREWAGEWNTWLFQARREIAARTGTCAVVVDGQHRGRLWRALQSARHRLVITSENLDGTVVTASFVRALEDRLRAGASVLLVYDAFNPSSRDELLALARRYPSLVLVTHKIHAKLLIWDRSAVVTSFNFLSFAGIYEKRRKIRAELGVWIRNPATAEELLTRLLEALPARDQDRLALFRVPLPVEEEGEQPSEDVVSETIDESPAARLARLVAWVREARAGDRWQRVAQVSSSEPPATVRRVTLAALHQALLNDEPLVPAAPQLRELAEAAWHGEGAGPSQAWQALAYALLVDEAARGERLPPEWMLRLAAHREDLVDLAVGLEDAALRLEGAVVGLADGVVGLYASALVCAGLYVNGLAELAAGHAHPAVRRLLDAAITWWKVGEVPLPPERRAAFRRLATAERHAPAMHAEALAHWKTKIRDSFYNFKLFGPTWRIELVPPQKPLGMLAEAVERRDRGAVLGWKRQHADTRDWAAELLDAATARAFAGTMHRGDRIGPPAREHLLHEIHELVRLAGAWVEAEATLDEARLHVPYGGLPSRDQDLAVAARRLSPELAELAKARSEDRRPEAPLLRELSALVVELAEMIP